MLNQMADDFATQIDLSHDIKELNDGIELKTISGCTDAQFSVSKILNILLIKRSQFERHLQKYCAIVECLGLIKNAISAERTKIILTTVAPVQNQINDVLKLIDAEFKTQFGSKITAPYSTFLEDYSNVYLPESESYFYLIRKISEGVVIDNNSLIRSMDVITAGRSHFREDVSYKIDSEFPDNALKNTCFIIRSMEMVKELQKKLVSP
jgi:hypothetical protein